jgi:hypothetical protein
MTRITRNSEAQTLFIVSGFRVIRAIRGLFGLRGFL